MWCIQVHIDGSCECDRIDIDLIRYVAERRGVSNLHIHAYICTEDETHCLSVMICSESEVKHRETSGPELSSFSFLVRNPV